MGAEFLLYGYGLVCVSMLVFNLLYSFYLRAGDRRVTRREDRLRQRVEEIDRMDLPGFLRIRAWNARQEQKKKEPRRRYIDEVWPGVKP